MFKKVFAILFCFISLSAMADNEPCAKTYPNTPSQNEITQFAQMVSPELFDYDSLAKNDSRITSCFSKTGWDSYKKALEQSGNLKLAEEKKLTISVKVIGDSEIGINAKENWTVTTPVQLHLENETHEANQQLEVKLLLTYQQQHLLIEQVDAKQNVEPTAGIKATQDNKKDE